MPDMLKVVATLEAKPGCADRLRDLLESAVRRFRSEHGCIGYVLLEDRKQLGRFMTYETWINEAALEQHMKSPAMQALTPKLKDLLEKGIKQEFLTILMAL